MAPVSTRNRPSQRRVGSAGFETATVTCVAPIKHIVQAALPFVEGASDRAPRPRSARVYRGPPCVALGAAQFDNHLMDGSQHPIVQEAVRGHDPLVGRELAAL